MAQIIKLKRGSLESVISATPRAGELLVITGSDGITAANGDGLVLVGIDGSTLTPANKIFQGTSTPDLSGASYDTSIDGIPFYRTDLEKLFIINKGGNLEVKATPQTGGTNIYSSSAQVAADVTTNNQSFDFGEGTLTTTGLSSFAIISGSSIDLTGDAKVDGSITVDTNATVGGDLDVTGQANFAGISGSSIDITGDAKIDGNITLGGNLILGDDPDNDSVTFNSDVASDIIPDGDNTRDLGSSTLRYQEIHGVDIFGAINATNGVVSGSGQLTDMTGDITVNSSGVSAISSDVIVNDDVKSDAAIAYTKLDFNGSNHYSGSAQVAADIANDNRSINVGTGRVSGDDFGTEAGSSTFTGSFEGDGSALTGVAVTLNVSSSDDDTNMSIAAKTEVLTFAGTSNEVDVTINDGSNTVQIGLPSDVTIGNDLTVTGNLTVAGTQTIVDSETINISGSTINVNYGGGAVEGGLQVTDATGGGLATGSLVWDGSADYWKGGVLGSEIKLLREHGDDVVSGSAQITLTDAVNTGFNTSYVAEDSSNLYYTDARVKTKLDAEGVVSQSLLNNLTNDEVGQLENIGTSTISATQWGYVGAMDQDVTTTSNVNFGNIDASGYVSASNAHVTSDLKVKGNVDIDGNITIGGDLTLGNETGDTIAFSGQVSTDIIADEDNSHDLGASNKRFAEIHGTDIFGAINATNNVVSGSSNTSVVTVDISSGVISANLIGGVVSGSAQTVAHLLNSATDFGTGRVSGDNFGDADGGSTFTGSFEGDGSALTGLNAEIVISGSNGQQTIQSPTTALTYAGGTGVSSTVDSDGVITTSVQDASTSAKGIASFDSDDFSVSSGNVSIAANGVRGANLNADVAGTGITYALDNTLEVDYGATDDTAVEGSTTATFTGTANEITVSDDSAQALGGGISVQIGLPDDVTIADSLTVNGNVQLGNATSDTVTIAGDLVVQGTTTTVDSTQVTIGDRILELNYAAGAGDAGLLVTDVDGTTASGSLLWNSTNDVWTGGAAGSEKEFARKDGSVTSNTVLKSDANGLLVDSTITDDGTDVSITGDFTINGLAAANVFVYADSNKTVQSVAPTTEGDYLKWDGSAFIRSNEIDGGTF